MHVLDSSYDVIMWSINEDDIHTMMSETYGHRPEVGYEISGLYSETSDNPLIEGALRDHSGSVLVLCPPCE